MAGSNTELIALYLAGAMSLLLMAAAIALFMMYHQKRILREQVIIQTKEIDYQKRMLKAALEAQENERKRVSKDLHDNVGMMLMTLRINLNNQTDGPLKELTELVDETNESVRRISWDLMPSTLDNFGLFQSTKEMCQRLSSLNGITLIHHEQGKRLSLDKDQDLLLYRIAQESIANAIAHAHATKIDVLYQWSEDHLNLSIKDDGLGFDFPNSTNKISGRHGLGLYNMENRVALLGGKLAFEKNKPSGSIVSVTLSLASHERY